MTIHWSTPVLIVLLLAPPIGAQCVDDMDGDGICDPGDNCPGVANPDQLDGDGDRVGNACDTWQTDLSAAAALIYGGPSTLLGYGVEVGDPDGDGQTDLAMSGPIAEPGSGAAFILFGPVAGRIDLAVDEADVRIDGDWTLGYDLAFADLLTGDDGKEEFLVSTPWWPGLCACETCYGGLTGVIPSDELVPGTHGYVRDLVYTEYSTCENRHGYKVEVGDVDHDETVDIVVSSHPGQPDSDTWGEIGIYYNDPLPTGTLAPDCTLFGQDGERVGESMAIGDVTGDGIPELVVGAIGSHGPAALEPAAGAVYIVGGLGPPGCFGDGSREAELETHALAKMYGDKAGDLAGHGIALFDQDGDGKQDILVGSPGANTRAGAAHLVLGTDDLAALEGRRLGDVARHRIDGDAPGAELGTKVAMGDLDGDAFGDLVLALPHADGPAGERDNAGTVVVLPGARLSDRTRFGLSDAPPSRLIHGASPDDELSRYARPVIARVSGAALPDVVLGAPWAGGPDDGATNAGEVGVLAPDDTDGDGRIDRLDCLPEDPSSIGLAPTGFVSVFADDKTTFSWSPVDGAERYTLFRGTIDRRWHDDAVCIERDLEQPTAADSSSPAAGTGYWYDSSAHATGCDGPLGSGSSGLTRTPSCP
jgi:hypothetical protein